MYFRTTALGTYCLGTAQDYTPAPIELRPVLRVLPNLEIVAIGADLEQGDRLALDAYAVRVSDLVWQLEASKLLAATEEGRSVDEIREFLSARSGAPLPDTVVRLLEDVAERCTRVHDRGLARLIECADPAIAALIANVRHDEAEQKTGFYTMIEEHLAVPFKTEVLGVEVTVDRVEMTGDEQIVAVCTRETSRQRISILDLRLPDRPPKGVEWLWAFRQ